MLKLDDVQKAISTAGVDWSAGETVLSRLDPEQRQRRLGYDPPDDGREPSLADRAARAGVKKGLVRTGADNLGWYDPRVVDGGVYVSPIKDQGDCKACVAFGTAATVEATLHRSLGIASPQLDLSEAQMFFCYGTGGFPIHNTDVHCDKGWTVEPLLDAITSSGVVPEACFPYLPFNQCCEGPGCTDGICADANAQSIAIGGFVGIDDENRKRDWIATRGPLITCLTVFEDFYFYTGGIYEHVAGVELQGGHCVSCIGFNDAEGYWICQNSEGTDWGERGFFRIAYGEAGIDDRMWGIIP